MMRAIAPGAAAAATFASATCAGEGWVVALIAAAIDAAILTLAVAAVRAMRRAGKSRHEA